MLYVGANNMHVLSYQVAMAHKNTIAHIVRQQSGGISKLEVETYVGVASRRSKFILIQFLHMHSRSFKKMNYPRSVRVSQESQDT